MGMIGVTGAVYSLGAVVTDELVVFLAVGF